MPLETGKSKEAFSRNVATEVNAGKPQDQAAAIAYSEAGLSRKARLDKLIAAADALERRVDAFTEGDHPRDEDGKFKGVSTTHKKRSGETEYKKVVSNNKPNFSGSGRHTQTITKTPGGVYSKSEHGYHQTHGSVEEAAKLFGWEKE